LLLVGTVFSLICLTILQYVYTSREWDKANSAARRIAACISFIPGLGQARRFDLLTVTSGVPPTSDIAGPGRHFRKVPPADFV
jgi:hypothetical protein